MGQPTKTFLLSICLTVIPPLCLHAGPPYLTDDPEPTDYHQFETYLFTLGETARGAYNIQGPAYEINYGAFPDTQLSLTLPVTSVGGNGTPAATGLGDIELGVKYRFVQETNGWPQISFYPSVFIPTGDANRGLGNGRAWYQLPLWAQKSFGPWTTYGGGGENINPAPGERNYPFGGWLTQRQITKDLSIAAEVYAQGQDTDADRGFVGLNAGGIYDISEHYSVLGSIGHSIAGDDHILWYFALGIHW